MKHRLTPRMKVYQVMRLYPELTDYFMELGLCGCSFGDTRLKMGMTLEALAKEMGLGQGELLQKLEKEIS